MGLSNGGLRPLSAICAQSSTIVHFCGFLGPFSKGNFRHKMTTIVGNRGQLWTSTLSPHLLSPHLDFPLGNPKRGLSKGGLARKGPIGPKRALSGQFLLFPRGCGVQRNWSRSAPKRPRPALKWRQFAPKRPDFPGKISPRFSLKIWGLSPRL